MASNSYGWATPTRTTGKGGGGGGQTDIYGELINPDKTAPKAPAPWNLPPSDGNQALQDWGRRFGSGSPVNYADENARNMAEGYANYFAIPFQNAQMADRVQGFNEYNTGRNFDEQARVNTGQMDLANRGSAREDLALNLGQQNNVRDFGEAKRQYDAKMQLDTMLGNGQIRLEDYKNATERLGITNQNTQAQATNATNRYGLDLQNQLGMTNAGNTRYGMTNDYNLGLGQNANTTTRNANDLLLGQQANSNSRYGMDLQNQQGIRTDSTNRYGLDLQNQQGIRTDSTNRYGMNLQDQQQMRTDSTNRYGIDQTTGLGRQQDATNRYGMDLQNQLGMTNAGNTRYGMTNEYNLGREQNANTRYGMNQNYSLGMGQNANQAYANQAQAQRYQGQTQNEAGANQNSLLNIQNQYALGQGSLGFQNRELDTNEAYRRSQLSQEADLTREKFKNDLIQSRYSAFGRAASPNARALRSWY